MKGCILLLLIICTLMGCTSSFTEPIEPIENYPPEIISLIAEPATIVAPDITGLDIAATDKDGDELTFTWSARHGEISTTSNPTMVVWFSGNLQPSDYRITCTVSDGKNITVGFVTVFVK